MQVRWVFAVVAIALAGGAVAALFQPSAGAAPTPGDVSGAYAGKGGSKTFPISGEIEGGGGGFEVSATASQEGTTLTLTLVIDPDGDAEVWSLSGRAGNGRFWAAGEVGDGDFVTVAGTAKGGAGKLKLKGNGQYLAADHYSEFKVALSQVVAPQ